MLRWRNDVVVGSHSRKFTSLVDCFLFLNPVPCELNASNKSVMTTHHIYYSIFIAILFQSTWNPTIMIASAFVLHGNQPPPRTSMIMSSSSQLLPQSSSLDSEGTERQSQAEAETLQQTNTGDDAINSASRRLLESDKINDNNAPGVQLTPYQILHPYLFSPYQTGADIHVSLDKALHILKQAIEQIQATATAENMDFILEHTHNPKARILRIEQTISHTVDPLCWLHAQGMNRPDNAEPTVYFSNAEQTFEATAIGAAHLHHHAANDDLWKFLQLLPQESQVYGGERFDRHSEPDAEWKHFGSGLWMLPTIELRRNSNSISNTNKHNQSHNHNHTTSTTLAIHILRNKSNYQTWDTQAALAALAWITHHVSESAPPTNLPPVISRDGTYGPDLDSQEVYERGVTAALEQFASSNLEKVVLARRANLVFDKWAHKVTALDILRKWKFGSNEGGHLLYMRPPKSSQEFFGCTPEQLFCVKGTKLITEALAGTRPRGSTHDADVALSRDLFNSQKDRAENEITGRFIRSQLQTAVSWD